MRHAGAVYGASKGKQPGSKHLYRPTWSGGKWDEFLETRSTGHCLQVCAGGSYFGSVRIDLDGTAHGRNVTGDALHLPFRDGAFETVACDPPYEWDFPRRIWLQRELARVAARRILFKAPWIPRATGWRLVETLLVASETCANVAVMTQLDLVAKQLDLSSQGAMQ